MAEQQQSKPGGHYSGANPVPNIKKFMESLDKDKKNRDAQIDAQSSPTTAGDTSDATPHTASPQPKSGTQKTVTDPVTGNNVVIEDASKDMFKHVDNPSVSINWGYLPLKSNADFAALGAECKSRQRYRKFFKDIWIYNTNRTL
jgi:hypothetical protein